ncbi:hypothetical protein Tco_0787215 [Tanacetum coccineum]
MQESKPPKKIKKRVQVQMSINEELAQKVFDEEQAKFNAEQEARFKAEQEQERIDFETALELQKPFSVAELEVQRLKRAGQDVVEEPTKRQRTGEASREDLVKLWSLVKERFNSPGLTDDKEKELWVELKRLFESDEDDTL